MGLPLIISVCALFASLDTALGFVLGRYVSPKAPAVHHAELAALQSDLAWLG